MDKQEKLQRLVGVYIVRNIIMDGFGVSFIYNGIKQIDWDIKTDVAKALFISKLVTYIAKRMHEDYRVELKYELAINGDKRPIHNFLEIIYEIDDIVISHNSKGQISQDG